jgi:acetylornithine/N-succinyldiaminopimelate aminotransferase
MKDNAQELAHKYHVDLYGRFPLTLTEGHGCHVKATNGKTYLDALAGIAVNCLGYAHPLHTSAIREQAQRLVHTSNFFYNEAQSELAKLLAETSGLDKAFFCNSGAEAVEGAIKLARKYAHIKEKSGNIISMKNCFHGRTLGAIAMGKEKYQKGFAPMAPGFEQVSMNDIEQLRERMNEHTVAIIMETIQGEGGIHPVEEAYLNEARALCDRYDALLILDEIQCGIARTGTMFAYQQYDVMPDIITSAKALGGGVPIGAVVAKEHVAAAFGHGEHGTTYGGNPLACAAACATLNTILGQDIAGKSAEKGDYFMDKVREEARGWDAITDVRGRGLMMGVELNFEGARVVEAMMERGVISNCASGNIMRIVPPLIITKKELDTIFEALIESIKEVEQHHVKA